MYIDTQTVITAASFVGALGVIIGIIISIYRLVAQIKDQTRQIREIMAELTVIDYGLKGALEGLIESGCNGPCKDALDRLNRHLNKQAHQQEG